MKEFAQHLTALVVGVVLFSAPFVWFGVGGAHVEPHADHGARHGGRLLMVGDHHVELVRKTQSIELYLSDRNRRPIRPAHASFSVKGADVHSLTWSHYRMVGVAPSDGAMVQYRVQIPGGETLSFKHRSKR